MTTDEAKELVFSTLDKVFQDNKNKGLISIYLWGSIATPDFDPESSDIDAVGILSDAANFDEMDKMRDWLPKVEPKLKRLQINFFHLSELKGGAVRSRLARLHDAEQAVFDFPYWIYVVGRKFQPGDFPAVASAQVLKHQVALTKTKMGWAVSGEYGAAGLEYFCKGLAWLCYDIHKLSAPLGPFSWKNLQYEATNETKELVGELLALKSKRWDPRVIRAKMPYLLETARKLTTTYRA
ncbi:MAG: hypothetical protein AAB896_02340 [Patescibacteria group bacterium]